MTYVYIVETCEPWEGCRETIGEAYATEELAERATIKEILSNNEPYVSSNKEDTAWIEELHQIRNYNYEKLRNWAETNGYGYYRITTLPLVEE